MSETIMMIHGMWGGAWCWDEFAGYFEQQGYECVRPYLRHHDVDPQAPPPAALGRVSVLDYVDDLTTEVARLATPPIVIGHSMGALLAQLVATRVPVRALVLLTPAPPRGINAINLSTLRCFRTMLLRRRFWCRPGRPTFGEASFGILHRLEPAERERIYARFVDESGWAAFEIGLWPFDRCRATQLDVDRIRCPVFMRGAALDRLVPAPVVEQVARLYGERCDHLTLPDHAHWLIGEPGWHEVAAEIDGWLRALPDRG